MRRNVHICLISLSVFLIAVLLGGCGSAKKEGGQAVTTTDLANAVKLGDANCLQCHNAGKDLTMINDLDTRTIGAVWQDSLHNGDENGIETVHCEDCHGGGQFHWGLGPLANPVPDYNVCEKCHSGTTAANLGLNDKASFVATPHANTAQIPDKFFFQGNAGTDQASTRMRNSSANIQEVTPDGTPVTKAQHIEECSVCHNSNWRFTYDNSTPPKLLHPDPNNMPAPSVSCANCHDGHQVAKTDPNFANGDYQIFRKVQVAANGANDANKGTWTRARMYRDDLDDPTTHSYPLDANGKRELNIETMCGSCHTVGKYKFANFSTHQTNVYTQWTNSAHATRTDPAWGEFSANPTAYDPTFSTGHQTTYPFDMSKATGNPGNNNYACFKCHNGIGSIDWQSNVQGTASARVIWGDEPATCITCHDTHPRTDLGVAVNGSNIRKPVVMTNYSTASAKVFGNVFLDTTQVPVAAESATSVICIFCHQGRESGFTLYRTKFAPGKSPSGAFFNNHYLGTAAMLWGANGYEYAGQSYSFNVAHQGANCATCHMANPTTDSLAGGHTWERNVATCNTATCHGGFGPIPALPGSVTPDLSAYRATFDTNNYSGDAGGATQGIADAIRSLQQRLIALLAAQPTPIFYNDLKYPYFFADAGFTTNYTNWNPAQLKAAFNLSYVIKGLPSSSTSQANVPNGSAAAHDYKYCIQLLQDSIADLSGAPVPGAFRPAGTRPATVYGTGQ